MRSCLNDQPQTFRRGWLTPNTTGHTKPAGADAPASPSYAPIDGDRLVDNRARDRSWFSRKWLAGTSTAFAAVSRHTGAKMRALQVSGANYLRDADGHFPFRGSVVWVFSHSDAPGDSTITIGARNHVAKTADGHRPVNHYIMRRPENPIERFITGVVYGDLITHVVTKRQTSANESPEAAQARRAANRAALDDAKTKFFECGEQQGIFPQGMAYGDGTIRVQESGALFAFSEHEGKKAPYIFCGISYEFLTGRGSKCIMNVREPLMVVVSAEDRAEFQAKTQEQLSRLNALSTSGIAGAYLLEKRALAGGAPVTFSKAELVAVVEGVVARARQNPAACIDEDLLHPATRQRALDNAFENMIARRYLEANGDGTYALTDALGAAGDPSGPALPKTQLRYDWDRTDPLRFWGNRTLQQAWYMPELRGQLDEVFKPLREGATPPTASAPEEDDDRVPSGCVIS